MIETIRVEVGKLLDDGKTVEWPQPTEENREKRKGVFYYHPPKGYGSLLGCIQCGEYGAITKHGIELHDDGTLTLRGSILCPYCKVHYFIERSTVRIA